MTQSLSTYLNMFPRAVVRLYTRCWASTNTSTARHVSTLPRTVRVSAEERAVGSLTDRNLELANRSLHHDGLVVLEDAIEHSKLDLLNEKMVADARLLEAKGDDGPYNYNKGNIQQSPPLVPKYFAPEIFLNPLATQVTSSILGPRPRLSFISANSAMPPTAESPPKSQPVHSDADFAHPASPFALVVNVPLVTMTPENGSTEVWLGTHSLSSKEVQEGDHGERASGMIRYDGLEARRQQWGPSQPIVKKGSIVVRDLRLWHAGKPNLTDNVRIMLAFIHFAAWYRNPMKITFAEELRPTLERYKREVNIQGGFAPESNVVDNYLDGAYGNAFDFDQKDHLDVSF